MTSKNIIEEHQGVVYQKTTGHYTVHCNGQVVVCSLSNRLRKQLIYPTADPNSLRHAVRQVKEIEHTDPVAVGDEVRFVDGMIVDVLPRRNRLARRTAAPMPGAHTFEQVIVANVDQVVPVFAAAEPAPKWGLLDRYLVSAEASGLEAVVVVTKLDLVREGVRGRERARKGERAGGNGSAAAGDDDGSSAAVDEALLAAVEEYRRIGYRVVLTSALDGDGLDELRQALGGRVSVLLGKSGVGKTSLLNALQPGLGLRVQAVSQVTGKGRHTTTNLEMFPLAGGGAVVDTPGIREFGLWETSQDDLALFFPEMRRLVGRCRFGLGCRHDEEPGCAIRQAVLAGQINPQRYQSLLRLTEELA